MAEWWSGLTTLNQAFFVIAVAFSALFVWQLLSAIFGMFGAAGGDMDMHADVPAGIDMHPPDIAPGMDFCADVAAGAPDVHVPEHLEVGGAETVASFRLISIRSLVAFGTLFGWAGALYLEEGLGTGPAVFFALLWALAGMLVVSAIFYLMQRMTETGTPVLATAIGQPGTVYMDIPAGGAGKVRTLVGGVVTFVNARAAGGAALSGGTPIRVRRLVDSTTVEVEKAAS